MKGMVAYSFALGPKEPNICNQRLARAAERIIQQEEEPILLVSQWEISRAFSPKIRPALIVEKHRESAYLDSKEVTSQAAEIFRRYNITEVIPVAQSFFHIYKCIKLIRQEGFRPVRRRIGWIGFYRQSFQWYTRGPIRLFIYAVLQKLTGRKGEGRKLWFG